MTSRNSSERSTTKEGMGPLVESAKKEVSKLKQLLNEEFECIKTDQLDRLKALHESKNEILASISLTKDDFEATGIEGGNELISAWSSIIDEINKCKLLHSRNETLIVRKLDSIRAALSVIRAGDLDYSFELYDKRGSLSRNTKTKLKS